MYGYSYPKQPDLDTCRVLVNEDEIRRCMAAFPTLTREQVIAALLAGRPDRHRVEEILSGLARGL